MVTWAVVTARMGSVRLPGKSMADLLGVPSLGRICERLARTGVDGVVVATSSEPADATIRDWAGGAGIPCHAGSLENVLSRTLGAAEMVGAQRLVFVNGDSPLTAPEIVDQAIARHDAGDCDYVSSLHGGGSYPDGFSVEVFPTAALELIAGRYGGEPAAREHVTTGFYAAGSNFRVVTLAPAIAPPAGLHLSLDTAADLELIRDIYRALLPSGRVFGYDAVMRLLSQDADLMGRACPA